MPAILPPPRLVPTDAAPPLRWGVIGTGIADNFTRALHAHTNQRVVAVATRTPEHARAFAIRHEIPTAHATIGDLVADRGIDVVYVATPHPAHRRLALEAIAAGKHVLIEKPIAMSAREAGEITSAGRAAGVLVMEAMWTRYLPQSDIIRQLLSAGAVGEVTLVRADFGFTFPVDPQHRLWNPELGGGALLDAGVYPISFISSVLGRPSSVTALGEMSHDVDARADVLLAHDSGAVGFASTSLVSSLPVVASIIGTRGRIDVGSPFFGPSDVTYTVGSFGSNESATWRDRRLPALHDGLAYQATALASYVAEGRLESPLHPHEELVSVMATIDDARAQVVASAHQHVPTSDESTSPSAR